MPASRDDYTRLYELLTLIDWLRTSMRGHTYDDMRDKFGWETKTIERMMKLLENQYPGSFVKERGEGNKRYIRLKNDSNFPHSDISGHEIVALETALGFIKTNEPLRLPLESLAAKLEALKGKQGKNIEDLTLVNGTASAPRPRIRNDRRIIEELQNAILIYRMVQIKYKQSSDGVITPIVRCPLGFLYGMQNNYLVAAREDEIEQPRHYILSQILDVEVMGKTFDAKGFDIHKYAQKSFGVWISSEGGHKIKWRVSPEVAERARQFIFHPTQKITPQDDGSLIVEFVADGLKEMVWHLMTWEGKIQPLAPRELIDEYVKQLELAAEALKPSSRARR